MPIAAGARFGPYEVLSALGAGGMGEVYRARDTKLGRDVALKVLPESFAAVPDRLARFRREAQLLASLNHPHIGAIYGLEDAERPALVLELVEGPTLADRLAQGPIPLDEALAIARQIAEALEAAHDKGIIHRDLKPANIKLTPDDKVKVLDFGLAKLSEAGEAHGSGAASLSPTMLSPAAMTHAGVILGTAAYMSPEQARGKPVDRRVDIWAFGCVLFEMLSGRRPFEAGETVSDAVAAVLRGDPDWLALPADTPSAVRWLIRCCLEKDPQARVAHIAAARYELDRPPEPIAAPVVRTASSSRGRLAGLTAAALAGVLVTALAAWRLIPNAPVVGVTRFSVPIVTEIQLPNAPTQVIAISRDGRQVVYGGSRLYRRLLSEREAIPIPGTEAVVGSASQPVFSPDGTSIAFVTGSPGRASLKRIDLGGGPAATLTDVLLVLGMSWDASGILYAEARRGIVRISPTGGEPEVLVPQDANKPGESFQGPRMLPDGKTLIYGIVGASLDFDDAQIVAQRIGSTERRVLVRGGTDARYIPTGHLVYASRGVLYAVAFDAETLTVGERPVPVIQGVMGTAVRTTGSAFYDVSNNGTLWYVPGGTTAGGGRTLMAIDRSGAMQTLNISPGAYEVPRLSPDGTFVAFELAEGSERNIWIYNLSGASSMRRLTFGGSDRFPVWSADGRRVTYQSTRDGDSAIYWQLADGTGPAERLTKPAAGEAHVPESWSPRGDFLLLESRRQDSITMQVLAMRDRTVSQFGSLASTFPFGPTFSPDGRWVAYSTLLPGAVGRAAGVVTNAVFIEPFPPTGAKYQVSKDDDGHHPVWTANGRELIYTRGPGQVAAVAITPTPTFSFSEPVSLGAGMMSISPAQRRGHDPMPDGRRFVAAIAARADGGRADVTGEVVVNWFEELKRLVER